MKKWAIFLSLFLMLATGSFLTGSKVANGSLTYTYGKHYPNGQAAVSYIYGPNGMWKNNNPTKYNWNYYAQYATSSHPFDKAALIKAANGTAFYTARDANGHLLLDFNHNGEIDTMNGEYAFHEHNGKGLGGAAKAKPFTQFWYDDNMLARFMSNAYGMQAPYGLSYYADFTRWQILGGGTANWKPYGSNHFDTLALDGMYYLSSGNVNAAISKWNTILNTSGYFYDVNNQQYNYPNIHENYHMGLFKILNDHLMDNVSVSHNQKTIMLQHSISLRSHIINNQQIDSVGSPTGWITDMWLPNSLINTESIAANVLALGANAKYVYEAGKFPMQMTNAQYFPRPHNVLSAVNGFSLAGFMTYGPYHNFPIGSYAVEFLLRAPVPQNHIATIDVYDANTGQTLATHNIMASEMNNGNQWSTFVLNVNVTNPSNSLEFRTIWYGGNNLDVAAIRVR